MEGGPDAGACGREGAAAVKKTKKKKKLRRTGGKQAVSRATAGKAVISSQAEGNTAGLPAEAIVSSQAEGGTAGPTAAKPKRKKRRRYRLHEFRPDYDIKYLGPLNYQHFQIIGWLCIAANAVLILSKIGNRIGATKGTLETWIEISEDMASMALPFLLLANFAQILSNKVGYKRLLIKNGAATLGIAGVFYFLYFRYFLGAMSLISKDPSQVEEAMDKLISFSSMAGFFVFNIFLDLFLCVLVMFFLDYRPAKIFTGRRLLVFRSFALLPILYEVGCTVLKFNAARNSDLMPVWTYPLLPAKPPMTFVLFLALVIYIKTRELRFCRHGRTREEYQQFLNTRKNSWNVSVFMAVAIVLVSLADLVIFGFYYAEDYIGIYERMVAGGMDPDLAEAFLVSQENISTIIDVGFGKTTPLIVVAPLVLLYSYNRQPKYPELSALIPFAGIILILLLVLQGSYQILKSLNLPKVDLKEQVEELILIVRDIAT